MPVCQSVKLTVHVSHTKFLGQPGQAITWFAFTFLSWSWLWGQNTACRNLAFFGDICIEYVVGRWRYWQRLRSMWCWLVGLLATFAFIVMLVGGVMGNVCIHCDVGWWGYM